MEREELLGMVNEELGGSQLTLSEQTINEELDDELANFGDDEEQNSRLVSKIAARLKRLDGNLHRDVSQQVSEYKKQAEKRRTQSAKRPAPQPAEEDEQTKLLREMREEIAALKDANAKRAAAETKDALLRDVEKNLRSRFEKAGMTVNSYFLRSSLKQLDVPVDGADIKALTDKAEKVYTDDMKEAGVYQDATPRYGGAGGAGGARNAASEYFARKAKKEGWQKKQA